MKQKARFTNLSTTFLVAATAGQLAFKTAAFATTASENMAPIPKEMLEKPEFIKEQEREALRDKSHDYRFRIGDDASIGVVREGISIRKIFLLNTRF